jgi:hypothetical protein
VKSGDVGVVDDNVVLRIPSDGQPLLENIEDELITIIEVEGQVRHGRTAGSKKAENQCLILDDDRINLNQARPYVGLTKSLERLESGRVRQRSKAPGDFHLA